MSVLDLAKFDATPLQREKCDFIVVPQFVLPEALDGINADYPTITTPGNYPVEELSFGPRFGELVDELTGPEVRRHFAAKFDFDLEPFPTVTTIRRYMSPGGNIHNDSRSKKVTVLLYFNEEWHQQGGRLRMLRSADDMEDYYVEVPPVCGTLLAFRRNEYSYHGFAAGSGERRSLQMCYVEPRRQLKRKATGFRKVIRKAVRRTLGLR